MVPATDGKAVSICRWESSHPRLAAHLRCADIQFKFRMMTTPSLTATCTHNWMAPLINVIYLIRLTETASCMTATPVHTKPFTLCAKIFLLLDATFSSSTEVQRGSS